MPKRVKTIDLTELSPTCNKVSFEINKLDALHLEIETGEVIKSDTKVELFIMKPNNQLVSETITTISGSTVKIDVKNGALDVAGTAIGRIKLSDSDGTVSTAPFYFAINDSFTNDDAIVNEVGIGAIEELKKQIDDAQIDPEVLKNKVEETINNGGLDLDVASKEEVLILNSQLNTKASKFELEVERKRINNFTRLNEGSTTGDAELIDARISANGEVYTTAGENVRDIAKGNGIVDKAIAPIKTNFLQNNYLLNLFDGNYLKGKISGDTGACKYEDDENGKLAIIKIKPNTVYSVIKNKISRFNMVTSTKILKNNEIGDGSLNINLSASTFKNYTFTSGNNDEYLYVSVTINKDEDVFLQVVEGTQTELTTNIYSFIPNDNLDVYSKEEIDKKVFSFKNVDFLEKSNINLYDGETYFENRKIAGASPNMTITSSANCRTAVVEIKPNTTYSIILESTTLLENGKNYFKILTSSQLYNNSDYWVEGKSMDAIIRARNYTFTSGNNDKYLYIFYTDKNEECLIQVVEGTQTEFSVTSYDTIINPKKNLNVFNKNEVLDLIKNNTMNNRDIKCIKTGTNLEIYVPSKTSSNYIRYSYKRIDDNNINMHQWRVLKTYLVDKNFNIIFDFDGQTEWEGAILEQGASDFIGGFHGDENNVFLSVLIDGKEYDINGDDFNVDVKNEIRIVNNSILNRCNTPNDNVFNRYKVNIWNKDNYIVANRYIALQDFIISS